MSFDIDTLIKKFSYSNPIHYHHHQYIPPPPHHHQQQQEQNYFNSNKFSTNKNETNFNNKKQIEYLNPNQISSSNNNNINNSKKPSNKFNLTTSLITKPNNSFSPPKHYQFDTIESSSSSSSSSSSASFASTFSHNNNNNNNVNSDKAKFFNTLKSLFAIFDSECNGSIDINELDVLAGNKNEILNDVLKYLRANSSYSVSSPSKLLNNFNFQSDIENRISSNANDLNNLNKANLQERNLKKSNKNNESSKSISLVTFDEFVKAAEIVLENRRQQKLNYQPYAENIVQVRRDIDKSRSHNFNRNSSGNLNNNNNMHASIKNVHGLSHASSSSLSNLNSIGSNANSSSVRQENTIELTIHNNEKKNKMSESSRESNVNLQVYATPIKSHHSKTREINKPSNAKIVDLNKFKNYSTLPITNMISSTVSTTSSTSSTPSSSSLSPSSSSSMHSTNYKQIPQANMHATTLSQAFEAANSLKLYNKQVTTNEFLNNNLSENSLILNNANSCDLNILLEKENYLLEQGLEKIELIKCWYQSQLKENKSKQANTQKLKHQNLFSIDKMLIDLKQLNDLNETFSNFVNQNGSFLQSNRLAFTEQRASSLKNKENSPIESFTLPAYHEYIEQYDLNKKENDLDKFLKEKQDKIEYLQKEKSQLIRKLFEMKSESANMSKNITQLQDGSNDMAKIQVANKQNEMTTKNIPIKIESRNGLPPPKQYVECKNSTDSQLKNHLACSYAEIPAKKGYFIQNVSLNNRNLAKNTNSEFNNNLY